ncbi:MAG: hypothetical protein AAFR35_08655 [Pseudomonadota bacterium]
MTKTTPYGWCPSAHRPMAADDGLLLRVKPPLGRLSCREAELLAGLARRYGSGRIELTNRANLQLRGFDTTGHGHALTELLDAGLARPDPGHEARRNVILAPDWAADGPLEEVARTLDAALAAPELEELPAKFGFVVDHELCPLDDVPGDVRLRRTGAVWRVWPTDHANEASTGISTGRQAVSAAIALALWFLATDGVAATRMARHLDATGLRPCFEPGRMDWTTGPLRADTRVPHDPSATRPAPRAPEGPAEGPFGPGRLVRPDHDHFDAEALAGFAANGALRLTPWRALVVEAADPVQVAARAPVAADAPTGSDPL